MVDKPDKRSTIITPRIKFQQASRIQVVVIISCRTYQPKLQGRYERVSPCWWRAIQAEGNRAANSYVEMFRRIVDIWIGCVDGENVSWVNGRIENRRCCRLVVGIIPIYLSDQVQTFCHCRQHIAILGARFIEVPEARILSNVVSQRRHGNVINVYADVDVASVRDPIDAGHRIVVYGRGPAVYADETCNRKGSH